MDKLEWFRDKRVTVMGLGFHGGGLGVTKWLCALGAKVTVTDLGSEDKLKDSLNQIKDLPVKLVLGRHDQNDFVDTDMVVRNPAIPADSPWLLLAKQHRVPIEMETSLFFKFSPTRNIVAITGTKGKTTTAHLMHHVLQTSGYEVKLAGNMAKSMVGLIGQLRKDDWLVLELSSFQCEGLKEHIETFRQNRLGPNYAIFTNLFEDHLNRYGSMEQYAAAKKNLFLVQNSTQYTCLRAEDEWREFILSGLESKVILSEELKKVIPRYQHKQNAALVEAVAKKIGVSDKVIAEAFVSFIPPVHRLEFVRNVRGVDFYNDSTATNPTAAASGLNELAKNGKKLVAILGGNDKNMDFAPLISTVRNMKIEYVLLEGTADQKLKMLPQELNMGSYVNYEEAIKKAYSVAQPDGIVTLSPGATSFNLFKDEFDRGDQFKEIVNNL